MRIRHWRDILDEVAEASGPSDKWTAIAGDRTDGLGEDLVLGHPRVGVYHLKTYAKNPFEVKGVGTRVARKIDDDLEEFFPTETSPARFGIKEHADDPETSKDRARSLAAVLKAHQEAPTSGEDLFVDVMEAMESPAYGPMEYDPNGRPDALDDFSDTFEEAENLLTSELDELIQADEIDRGFF